MIPNHHQSHGRQKKTVNYKAYRPDLIKLEIYFVNLE